MNENNQKSFFNSTYDQWKDISEEKRKIITETIKRLRIRKDCSVLDVACGTGVLYSALKYLKLESYTAIDISENMLSELKRIYPEAETICTDFDKELQLARQFDYIIIINSIPHFENLNVVFSNAKKHLKPGGTFSIVHARSRKQLKEHHRKIGYNLGRNAIPDDETIMQLTALHSFKDTYIDDDEYFYFVCTKS